MVDNYPNLDYNISPSPNVNEPIQINIQLALYNIISMVHVPEGFNFCIYEGPLQNKKRTFQLRKGHSFYSLEGITGRTASNFTTFYSGSIL